MSERAPHSDGYSILRKPGLLRRIGRYAVSFIDLLRDLTPERRRSRYGDIDFDFEHGVDTSWATVSLRTRVREWLRGVQYQPSEPELFREILEQLPIAFEDFTFIDLGAGKGRTLLMASSYPFRRIIGVELLPELHAIAAKNITRYKDAGQKCFAIESQALDAREFEFPSEASIFYLFNPFAEYVLRGVLKRLHDSLLMHPRHTYLIYHNLLHEAVFAEQKWLKPIHRTHQYALYEAGFQSDSVP